MIQRYLNVVPELLKPVSMLVFLIFSAFACFLALHSEPLHSAPLVVAVHSMCVDACPPVTHAEFMRAVVCGSPLANTASSASLHSDLVRTGLIHLLVVSGSHLIGLEIWVRFLSKVLRVSRVRDALIFSSLAFFVLMTLATPPVIRAFAGWTLGFVNQRWRLGWTRAQVLMMSGACTLATCRSKWDLGSLSLSWIAALGLAWGASTGRRHIARKRLAKFAEATRRELRGHATVYLALIPALIPLGVPSALSILCNLIFAPVMGFVLFPVSVLGYAGFTTLADRTWTIALASVKSAANLTPDPWGAYVFSPLWLMPYIFLLSLWLFVRERRRVVISAAVFLAFLPSAHANELIIWNVGQGSWATLTSPDLCEHFDIGGEFAPLAKIARICAGKRNEVQYSHWDWDHIGLTPKALRKIPNLCMQTKPGGETKSKTKLDLIASLPDCDTQSSAREIYDQEHGSANEESRVYLENRIVFPGDSPANQESRWRFKAANARILIAGHHGSKTSTSSKLLDTLRGLKFIVVSARKQKYGHPHPSMLARARAHQLPVLTTEDWGSLHIEVTDFTAETPRAVKSRTASRIAAQPAFRFPALSGDMNPTSP